MKQHRNFQTTGALAIGLLLAASLWGETAEQVKGLDQQFTDATIRPDLAALDRILSKDLIYTHSDGRTESKAQFIEALRAGKQKYEWVQIEKIDVRVYGDAAVVIGTERVKSSTQPIAFRASFLNVYAKHEGRWQMVAHQSTSLKGP